MWQTSSDNVILIDNSIFCETGIWDILKEKEDKEPFCWILVMLMSF